MEENNTTLLPYPEKAKIVIIGAGAIGGLLGVHLSLQGHTVTFVARGAHLEAMRQRGALQVISPDGRTIESSRENSHFIGSISELSAETDKQDVVILGLKMHQIQSVVADIPPILHEHSVIVTTQNGIPWWYFQQYEGEDELKDRTIHSVDPQGVLKDGIDSSRLLATVVYPAAHIKQPGVIEHVEGVRFPIGEPNKQHVHSDRVRWMSSLLTQAGFKSPVLDDVRAELWLKLWGTVAVNPLSALTHATLNVLCAEDAPGRRVVESMMQEVEQVAGKLGAKMRVPMERRVEGARKVGKHKTSMLQDVETGRELEIETILGSVVELARVCQQHIPCIETIHGTIQMLAQVMKESKSKVRLVPIEQ